MSSNQSSIKKTIQINPALFTVSKTRKNHHSGSKSSNGEKKIAPLISPNHLKNQLLRRIKEHKNKENEMKKEPKSSSFTTSSESNYSKPTTQDIGAYTDEFEESLNYLKSLSNRKEEMQKKTLKNYSSLLSSSSSNSKKNYILPNVDLELPESLQEITPVLKPSLKEPFQINYKVDSVVPYGVLTGGMKPTYRNFVKTQKNYGPMVRSNATSASSLNPSLSSSYNNESLQQNRMEILKDKIKNKQEELQQQKQMDQIVMNQHLIQKPESMALQNSNANANANENEISSNSNLDFQLPDTKIDNNISFNNSNSTSYNDNFNDNFNDNNNSKSNGDIVNNNETRLNTNNQPISSKRFLKRTIKRKYTLGKSKMKKTVGILLKDRNTRKKILMAHKDLKRTTIHDVKKYLRDHNLIKTGSNTPNDVIRKIYETAVLAGDITNYNNDILIHNLSKEDG